MVKQFAALVAIVALASCAGFEPAGRNATQTTSPAPTAAAAPVQTPAPTAEPVAPAPAPVAAPEVSAPAPRATSTGADSDIVVPGGPERQVPPPGGDPRSLAERMQDVRAWDQCVTAAQAAYETDPMRPQLDTPEDYCSRSLGMADRSSVPESRRRR